jgi:hypothetical protein
MDIAFAPGFQELTRLVSQIATVIECLARLQEDLRLAKGGHVEIRQDRA